MKFLRQLWARVGVLLLRSRADRETAEELRFHLDMETEKLVKRGIPRDAARRQAQLALGGVGQTQDAVRDERRSNWLEHVPQDVRYAFRRLRLSPGFTTVAVLTLALGIGANTAIYSVVDGVLLRALPFTEAKRLVMVWETDRRSGTTREPASWPDYLDYVAQSRSLDGAAGVSGAEVTLTPDQGSAIRTSGMSVTHTFFPLVGVQPMMGRLFSADDDRPNGPQVVIIGEALWRTQYGADPNIVGRSIRVNDLAFQVIGVVPHGADFGLDQIHARAAYHGPYVGTGDVGLWTPMQASAEIFPRSTHPLLMLGRLAKGTTVEQAQTEMAQLSAQLEKTYPQDNTARGVNLESLQEVVFGPTRPIMLTLLGAVALVLLVACVNVANLLLARGSARAREVAVRGALGAGVGRLARQCMTESILLALIGGTAGVGLAVVGLKVLLALAPQDIPRVTEVALNLRVLGATLVISVLVGLAFGLVPTVQAFHVDIMRTIRGEATGGTGSAAARRFREGLVIAELALSVTLVVCAGLLIRSFWSVLRVDPGFQANGVVKAEFQLPTARYPENYRIWPAWKEVHAFNHKLLEEVRAIPGVTDAGLANVNPLDAGFTNSFQVIGREAEAQGWPEISVRVVSPGYFSTLGVKLESGRVFDDGDDGLNDNVALINVAAAKRFFATQDPIGQQIRFWGTPRRIIGVVGDERMHGLTEPVPVAVYVPTAQNPRVGVVFAKVQGDPLAAVQSLRRAVLAADPGLAVYAAEPLSVTVQESVGQRRFAMLVLGAFAGATFLLALVGIHGVLSYTTSQRTREIGIRMALGATGGGVTGLVMRGGLRLAAVGTGLGLIGAAVGSKLLTGLLYGVGRIDLLTFVAVAATTIGAALLAIWMPAKRAAGVTPISCLRAE